jgi:hypothetical protein
MVGSIGGRGGQTQSRLVEFWVDSRFILFGSIRGYTNTENILVMLEFNKQVETRKQ